MSKPAISTDIIELDVVAANSVTIKHGLNRQLSGWQVIWSDVDINFHVGSPLADTSTEITLIPSVTGSVRLVLL